MGRPKQSRRVRDTRNAVYRELILDTAERQFGSLGYGETKMAGISLATLYGLFPGKRDLYDAIMADRGGQLVQRTLTQVRELAGGGDARRFGARAGPARERRPALAGVEGGDQ